MADEMGTRRSGFFERGISLFYLAYVLAIEGMPDEAIETFLQKHEITYSVPMIRSLYAAAQASAETDK
jgi:hypothetical protein